MKNITFHVCHHDCRLVKYKRHTGKSYRCKLVVNEKFVWKCADCKQIRIKHTWVRI